MNKPYTTGSAHTLPFDKLSPRDFERLCLWLVEREGFERAEHLGAAGSEQGRDVTAWRGDELWYFQCKRYRSIGATTLKSEVDKYLQLAQEKPHLKPAGVIFVTSCIVSAQAREAVGAYCDEHGLAYEFWAETELDEKVKRHSDIVEEFFQAARDSGPEPSWWRRARRHSKILYSTLAMLLLIFAAFLISRSFAFPPAFGDETLIVIASFHTSEGVMDTEIHNEIRRAIQQAAKEMNLTNLRVEVEPTRLAAEDRARAERLGRRYNASIIIWGSDTAVRVTVNFLNLKQPGLKAADVPISEAERRQLDNPSDYASLVTKDLPGQVTFLSLFAIGQSYYTEGAYADSIAVIERAIDSLTPDSKPPEGLVQAYFRLGWLHQMGMGNPGQAIDNYTKAIEIDPRDPYLTVTYYNRGIARADTGDLEGAISDYTRAIEMKSDYADAYNNRGLAHAAKGEQDEAIYDYTESIRIDPDYAFAYNNRGLAYAAQGNHAKAIIDYTRAIEIDPDYAFAYNNRGLAYSARGEYDEAIIDYARAIEIDPNYAFAYNNRGVARRAKGDSKGAIPDYTKAIEIDPGYVIAYNNRGNARIDLEEYEQAIADFAEAIRLDPSYAPAYNNRGVAHKTQGNWEEALDDFRHYLELRPDAENCGAVEEWITELEAKLAE